MDPLFHSSGWYLQHLSQSPSLEGDYIPTYNAPGTFFIGFFEFRQGHRAP
ncbi:unnamed protein product [Staurois parvus]|uniref:Uncharacterized protein n=1 Tax=Staurois parvus TaxID=386267 RepID=A0ABN9B863_9NEOB|nr:unnamed protein product [Staurois parvus]